LAGLAAMLTPGRPVRVGNQLNQAVRISELSASGRQKAFPAKAGDRSIEHGGGVLVWLLGRTNNLTRITRRHLIRSR
ncbi:hypothetical protein MWU49_17680, partial [Alcanivorax sp. S6407]|uniref:hypothetical protein n=1 Tax=Alcanivorax sp. S6407 TaxID=2926424 RepID=UPI001FF1E387